MRCALVVLVLLTCAACGGPTGLLPSPLTPAPSTVTVTIRVTDNGQPVPGAWVRHEQTSEIKPTDAAGAAQWTVAANTFASWSVRACRYFSASASGTFASADTIRLEVAPSHRENNCAGPIW